MFLKELKALNRFEISIITLQYPFLASHYEWFNLPVFAVGGKNKKGLSRIKTFFQTWKYLKLILNKNNDTTVLSLLATDAALISGYFCKYYHIKHYCWLIGQDTQKNNSYARWIPSETKFVAMSDFLKKNFEKNFKIKVSCVITNALNLSEIPAFKRNSKTYDFISVGSLIDLKRTDWVVQIISDLLKKNIQCNCVVIGDGPEKAKLTRQITELNLDGHIKLLGALPHRDVFELLFKSKILLHPSAFEGFSTVCIEALYGACHVITTCSPLSEIHPQVHPVHNYAEMLDAASSLMLQELIFESFSDYKTPTTAEQFSKIF